MAVKVNDVVIYHPGTTGRPSCEAIVTKVNDDGTVNIVYPHFADASAEATADSCVIGNGLYEVSLPGDGPAAPATAIGTNVTAKIESLEAEVERLTQELVAAGADEAKAAVASVVSFVDRFGFHPEAKVAATEEPQRISTTPAKADDKDKK